MGSAMEGKPQPGYGGVMKEEKIRTPYFLIDERRLRRNLEILKDVAQKADCKILLAQKAFSMFSVYPLIRQFLAGTTASGLYEARLGAETFGERRMYFHRHIGKMSLRKFFAMQMISFSTLRIRSENLGRKPKKLENQSDCVLIQSAPLRRDMKFTIHVQRDHALEQQKPILSRKFCRF